jgi:hypothetical protein
MGHDSMQPSATIFGIPFEMASAVRTGHKTLVYVDSRRCDIFREKDSEAKACYRELESTWCNCFKR